MQLAQAPQGDAAGSVTAFSSEVRYLEGQTIVALMGDLNADDVGELRRLIIGLVNDEQKTVVLDMSHLRDLHETSVEVIIEARRYILTRGGDLVLRAPVPAYFRVLAGWMREGTFAIEHAPPID